MAKAEFLRTIKKNIPFVNLSTTFIFLAILFMLSIVLFFVFDKHIIENLAGNGGRARTSNSTTSNSTTTTSTTTPTTSTTSTTTPTTST